MEEILIETKVLWGLVFPDSIYHQAALKVVSGKTVSIPVVCFHELAYPAYKRVSEGGKKVAEGLVLLGRLSSAYRLLEANYAELFDMTSLKVIPLTVTTLSEACDVLRSLPDLFVKLDERTGTKWPRITDAIVAATWKEVRLPLYAEDDELRSFGEREGLEYRDFTKLE